MGQNKEVPISSYKVGVHSVRIQEMHPGCGVGSRVVIFCRSIPWSLKHQESQPTVPASTLWKSLRNITPIYLWKAREKMNGNSSGPEKWSSRGFREWARSLLKINEVIPNISQWKDGAVVEILLLCIFAFVLNQMSSFKVGEKILSASFIFLISDLKIFQNDRQKNGDGRVGVAKYSSVRTGRNEGNKIYLEGFSTFPWSRV